MRSRAGSPRQRSGACAALIRLGRGPAFRLALKKFPARSAAAVTEGRSGAEEPRSGLTAVADRALPDAGDRPALMILPARGSATAAVTARSELGAARPYLRAGVEGAEPLAGPNVRTLVCWL